MIPLILFHINPVILQLCFPFPGFFSCSFFLSVPWFLFLLLFSTSCIFPVGSLLLSSIMQAKAIDLFHAYSENLVPPEGAVLVAARDEGGQAPLVFLLADVRSLQSIDHRAAGLDIAADGIKLEWQFAPVEGDSRLEIEQTDFSGPRALFVRRPVGKDFAFLFPRTAETPSRLRRFLEKTFAAESGLPGAAAETAADRVIALLSSPQKGTS